MRRETGMDSTDRKITSDAGVDDLDFAKGEGLLPVVAQDADTGSVLMVAFATGEALTASLESGDMHFWSRSRGELWRKGETSGNVLRVVSLHADCDADTVLALVRPTGPACHTGETTCFGEDADSDGGYNALDRLDATLAERARERPATSYTVKLLDDVNLRLKKLGEENAELVAALATSDGPRATEEAADLIYHTLVALRAEGIGLEAVLAELDKRAS